MRDLYEIYMDRAAQYYEAGAMPRALVAVEKALAIKETPEAFICRANVFDHLHRLDDAAQDALRACDIATGCRIPSLAANVLDRAKLGEIARMKLMAALDKPDDWAFGAMWAMGRSYRDSGLWFEALPWFKEASKVAPSNVSGGIRHDFFSLQAKLN